MNYDLLIRNAVWIDRIRVNQLEFRNFTMQSSQLLHFVAIIFLFPLQINGENRTSMSHCGVRIPAVNPLMLRSNISEHWPWHAAIYHVKRSLITEPHAVTLTYQCGGSLIDSKTVLTAAHCVCKYSQPLNAENVLVLLGKQNLRGVRISEFLEAINIIQHPNYSHQDFRNDIAIIKLSARVAFNNLVQPICLWDSNKSLLSEVVGKMGKVVGWGTMETGLFADTLQEANIPVVDRTTCLESNPSFYARLITTKTFCAGSRNGVSACNGDSGGGMTFEENGVYSIRGIVSLTKKPETGELLCDANEYTLFTDVAQYLPWITELAEECEIRVFCAWSDRVRFRNYVSGHMCTIHLNMRLADQTCKVLMETPDNDKRTNELSISGNVESLPDLTDVFKFNDFIHFNLSNLKLKVIERSQLRVAKRIEFLLLNENEIDEISPDTFDDLLELLYLDLAWNHLKVIHRDVFKRLHQIDTLNLDHNNLEVLPAELFRYNLKLRVIWISFNKIKIIATEFKDLPQLRHLGLNGNECISEIFFEIIFIGSGLPSTIWDQCKG